MRHIVGWRTVSINAGISEAIKDYFQDLYNKEPGPGEIFP